MKYVVTVSAKGGKYGRTIDASKCMLDGVKTVTIFSDMKGVRRRIARDGIASDWQKVGSDLWTALATEKSCREREAG